MNLKPFIYKVKDLALYIVIGLLMICAIFPKFNLSYIHGIDGSLPWVFNYIYDCGFHIGKNIIFPHGPLAFFMYPLQENLWFALIVMSALQLLLVILVFLLLKNMESGQKWLIATSVSFILLNLLSFNLLIFANILILYLLFNEDGKKWYYKYLAFFLAIFSFYVKEYAAIITFTITFSFLAISFFKKREILKIIKDLSILLAIFLIFWIIIYGSFSGMIQYLIGMVNLAKNNSSSASLYTDNYWFFLTIFLLITFLIPFFQKSQKGYYFGFLTTLSIFAGWKHGISREDMVHAIEFFTYIIAIYFIFILYVSKNIKYNIILISIAILSFGINLKNVKMYQQYNIELISVNNLVDFIENYSKIKEDAKKTIEENISYNKLPPDIVNKIGNATVDIYPWDLSVIPANNFNWQPRPLIQSHSTFTPLLDKKNADHFNSKIAPEFIVWHLFTSTQTGIDKTFEGVDGRYLLNDEPQTIVEILKNYELYYQNNDFLVYKRRKIALAVKNNISVPFHVTWNRWIPVPDTGKGITRVKVKIKETFLGSAKEFLYKGNYYYIYYKLDNGFILKNKIIPQFAGDGLWINPRISAPVNNYREPKVKEILFKTSDPSLTKNDIKINWENISFFSANKDLVNDYANTFFGKYLQFKDNLIGESIINFEYLNKDWSNINPDNFSNDAYNGEYSCTLQPGTLSAVYAINLDTLRDKKLMVAANCWVKPLPGINVLFVISVENNNTRKTFYSKAIKQQLINNEEWNNVSCFMRYKSENNGDVLTVFLVNQGKIPLLYDDFTVRVEQENPINNGTFYETPGTRNP